ncbi:uncharacterized protein LOC6561442 [Drosophila grimshawi]|uniref:GH11545 n=1 Tax=Drosophila grimshawi TaxID=7222 RepID=B4JBG0_DROGR|nr:uncharacterized protein LOC6561442 [Drosophila grimshawi]EDW03983.1 GH11545 [Drosophila grimshawi]
MFHSDVKRLNNRHKRDVADRSKNWGKKKFTPNAFRRTEAEPVPEETSQPWNHVKNDILDGEHEERNAERFDMNSAQAKEFRRQREQNHRRNIIETSRNTKTKWESFDDDNNAAETSESKTNPGKKNYKETMTSKTKRSIMENPQNMDFTQRNYLRRKLTKAVMTQKNDSLNAAIQDMKRNACKVHKDQIQPLNKNNKFRNN